MAHFAQMPKLTDTMEEGVIVKWMVKVGDTVSPGQQIAEVETDKAVMPMEAFDAGTVLQLIAQEGKPVPLGGPIYVLGAPGEKLPEGSPAPAATAAPQPAAASASPAQSAEPKAEKPDAKTEPPAVAPGISAKRLLVSPIAGRMAADAGIDLYTVTGSGPAGRIIKRDIEAAIQKKDAKAPAVSKASTLKDLTMMRKTVAKRLSKAWSEIPHFFLEREVDATAMRQLQKTLKEELPDAHISLNDILIKCSAYALTKVPDCNVSWTEAGIEQHEAVHVSVAVALEDGLITPVVRNADGKTVMAIAQEVRALAQKAKERRLQPEEYSGGTFSISNLGMFGIDKFTAIINPPEAMILAVGKVEPKPVVVDGQVVVRDRLCLTLSCDHRVVDGALGAKFLAELTQAIEHPLRMLVV